MGWGSAEWRDNGRRWRLGRWEGSGRGKGHVGGAGQIFRAVLGEADLFFAYFGVTLCTNILREQREVSA
eukprot:6803826-Pyramimonas_sp.AAC.1